MASWGVITIYSSLAKLRIAECYSAKRSNTPNRKFSLNLKPDELKLKIEDCRLNNCGCRFAPSFL